MLTRLSLTSLFLAASLAVAGSMAMPSASYAKTPKEVLEPYKAYRAALAEDNREEAATFAYEAWQSAEALMGDSKTTGDLAANYAELRPRYLDNKPAWKSIMKAHKRAIDLSSFHQEEPGDVEIDRRIKYLSWQIPTLARDVSGVRDKGYNAERLTARIQQLGMSGTTFEAESYALQAQDNMIRKKWKSALENSKRSIEIFENRTDSLFSAYEYGVPIYLARAYIEEKQPVEAALTYQALMDKLEIRGGHDNAISADAYKDWLDLRDEVVEMKSSDPRALQVVNYKVPDSRQAELSPLVRIPPQFPQRFLKGRYSGWVQVNFSVNEEGRVENIVATDYSNKALVNPTLDSVKKWRYSPNADAEKRKDLESVIRFDLQGRNGTRLPFKKPIPDYG